MKLKLLFLLMFFSTTNVFGESFSSSAKEIDIKTKKVGRPRSLSIVPVDAFLENTAIVLEFTNPCESITIEIINTDNGYSAYYNTMENPGNFVISMTGEESGYYKLELVIDGKRYSGEFWLE